MRRAVLRNQDVNAAEPSHDRQTTKAPARLPLTINFACRAYWTLEQALTAFELLDDLRDQIGAHYSGQPFELGREKHPKASTDGSNTKIDYQSI